jgi:hypothetical protein
MSEFSETVQYEPAAYPLPADETTRAAAVKSSANNFFIFKPPNFFTRLIRNILKTQGQNLEAPPQTPPESLLSGLFSSFYFHP